MIKQFFLISQHDRQKGEDHFRIYKKSWARWKRDGLSSMREKLNGEYSALQEEYVWFYNANKRYDAQRLRILFFTLFLFVTGYYMLIKSELYESNASIVVKDLNDKSVSALGLSLLGASTSSQMQDSMILEDYLLSPDVLALLNKQFDLESYYHSDALDPLSRLLPLSTREDFLAIYRSHLQVVYDEVSGILRLGFRHTDPKTAQAILTYLIRHAEHQLNVYNERNAEKQLSFVRKMTEKNREQLDLSTAALERYQNEHLILDPTTDAQTQSGIISTLEGTLVQKRAEYVQMKQYMSESSFDLIRLANEIRSLEASLKNVKATLTGNNQERLNAVLFAYEKLKSQVTFDTEVYKQSLIELESAKVDVQKQAKALVILTQPDLPDGYTYPDKPHLFLTMLLAFSLSYGITAMLGSIIKDHKD